MGPSGRFTHSWYIFMSTEVASVTRHPFVFRGLTGSQRTSGFGASHTYYMYSCDTCCKIREMVEMDCLD